MSSPSPTSSPPATNSTAPPPKTTVSPPAPSTTTPPPTATTTPPPSTTPSAPPPSNPPPPSKPPPSLPPSTATPPPSTPGTTPSPPSPVTQSPPPPSSTGTTPSPPSPTTRSPPSPSSHSGGSPPSSKLPPSSPGGTGGGNSPPSNSGISTGIVVGIAVAGVAVLVIFSIICVCLTRRKKRRRNDYGGGGGYYAPPPPPPHAGPPKDGPYDGQPQQHWQQNYPPPAEHYQVPKTPPGGGPPRLPPRPPFPQPPPPPPFMSSGGGSGSSIGSENPPLSLSPGISLGYSKSAFSYDELAIATNNFADENILGQGGFGYVHKGVLPHGKEVAVKSLKAGSGQGEREFQAEVEIISRVHHKHLVSLVGYCITGSHRLLVYEFVPNRTMEYHLHGKGRPVMDWQTRLRIALGSAKGLAYLHEDCHPKIIHRDIKAANILLNDKFEAMVADFGLAKFSSDANTHVSTRVMGTFGYLAPEYAASGKLTDKSDVFSFGVMLLELITGRRPVDPAYTYMDDSLVDWARPLLARALEENNFESLVDPHLLDNYTPTELGRMVACASACVRHSARRRPAMSKVVRALEGEVSLSDLNEGIRPGQSSMYNSHGSSDYDSGQYKEDMKKFRQVALASQEHGSSEYGATTSEYGVIQSGSSTDDLSRQTTREMEMGKMKGDSRGFSGE